LRRCARQVHIYFTYFTEVFFLVGVCQCVLVSVYACLAYVAVVSVLAAFEFTTFTYHCRQQHDIVDACSCDRVHVYPNGEAGALSAAVKYTVM